MDPPKVRRRRPSWAAFCRALRRFPGEAGSYGHLAAEGDCDLHCTTCDPAFTSTTSGPRSLIGGPPSATASRSRKSPRGSGRYIRTLDHPGTQDAAPNRARRLAKDFEITIKSALAWLLTASPGSQAKKRDFRVGLLRQTEPLHQKTTNRISGSGSKNP
jgi:hypothetical protein